MKKALCLISKTISLSLEPTGLYDLWAVGATAQGRYCFPAGTTTAPKSAYPVDPATLKKAAGFLGKDPSDFDGASLHSGGMSFALVPYDDAPVGRDRHLPEAYSCRLKGDDLLAALERVVPYLPKDRAWTDYDNVHVEATEGQVRLVATNGAIMGLQDIDVTDEEGDGAADWTPDSLWELTRVLKAFRPEGVTLSWDEKTFQIAWGGGAYYTGVAAPNWGVPYRKVLPSASTFALRVKGPPFARALKAQDKWDRGYRAYVVITVVPSGVVLLEGKGLDVGVDGSIEGYIVTPKDHEKDRIALRQALALKAIKGLGKGDLSLTGVGSMGPVAITSESAPGFLGIIMPIALAVCKKCGGLRHECSCEDLGGRGVEGGGR